MQKDLLFYQANFEPEVHRMIKAYDEKNFKYFDLFKTKTLKIIDKILELSNNFAGKEEWLVIKNLIENFEHINTFEVDILKNYGYPFSLKFARKLSH